MSELILGKDLESYFMEHVKVKKSEYHTPSDWGQFCKTFKPLHVFKKIKIRRRHQLIFSTEFSLKVSSANVWAEAIANLIIPENTTIYFGPKSFLPECSSDYRKMRAERAFVHSIFPIHEKTANGVPFSFESEHGRSLYSNTFEYNKGEIVWSRTGRNNSSKDSKHFSREYDECAEGIHFFLNLLDAKRWNS